MRQLDLFGFLETPAKEEKTEDIQPVLKKEPVHEVIGNKEMSSFLVDITPQISKLEALKDQLEINENADSIINTEEHLGCFTAFSSSGNVGVQTDSQLAIEESAIDAFVNEADADQKIIFPQDYKELKTDHFTENEEEKFEDEKSIVLTKNETALSYVNSKDNLKKEPQKRGRKSLEHIEAEVDLIEVPEDELLFKKQYYAISEVARWFRVNASLLRFWEKEFDILKPKKNGKGDRLFRPEDVKNLQLIYQLLRQRKYTIEGAKEYIKTNKKKADVEMQLATTLQKFKIFLLDLKANL